MLRCITCGTKPPTTCSIHMAHEGIETTGASQVNVVLLAFILLFKYIIYTAHIEALTSFSLTIKVASFYLKIQYLFFSN